MKEKQFKAESKRLLDLMINSIYTNKEIFLRELISNGSDAIDKLYYRSLTDKNISTNRADLKIKIDIDKENRNLIISDNGCGMTEKELETNLGTIAKSGSLAFKEANEKKEDIDIIGQFGVGFYSAFMVSDEVKVESKSIDSDEAYCWKSKGAEGYTIEPCEKEEVGTKITLHIKEDTEEENYSLFLEQYKIEDIVKKYSDYISYPIQMEVTHKHKKEGTENEYEEVKEMETLNSMTPIWKKAKSKVTDEEYNNFYSEKFYDFEKPVKVIHTSVEGQCSYNALLFIPAHLPYDYYTKEYKKGLQLYSNGVLIMEKCEDLLPDYFGFVKGLVDSQDLSLNISREMLQHDRSLKVIAKNIENKIKSELEKLLKDNRDEYEKFFHTFGLQLKYGTYDNYGANKDKLKDLLLFYSSTEKKLVTLKEYKERMKEGQDVIYYAAGETIDKIDLLPQVEMVKEKGFEILYLTDDIDEFVFTVLTQYEDKNFQNVCADNLDLDSEEEKESLKKKNEEYKEMFASMKDAISGEVQDIRFTHRLKNHPVCLTSEGKISIEMQKVLNQMPTDNEVDAKKILEINESHPIVEKLKYLYENDKEKLKDYTKILYSQARLIEGLAIENPTEISNLICDLIAK
ncbi:MAG: molecular chaperone HtpG [Clostridia bacterium]|nr:molecular chaperone HtpG [Clostridia bacterium]